MHKSVFESILKLPLSESDSELIQSNLRSYRLDKGEKIFSQGEQVPNIYALDHGLVKLCYITTDGKELIKSFISEGKLFGSLISQMGMGESTFSAVCLESTSLQVLPYRILEQLLKGNLQLQGFALELFKNLALKKEMREYSFLCLSAEQRYQAFLKQEAHIANRITQQDLARYLGITPIALSRLKSRLLKQNS